MGGRIFTHKESRARYNNQREQRQKGSFKGSSSSGSIGRPLELGAQWLHGTVGNPLFDFCIEEGIFDSQGENLVPRSWNPRDTHRKQDALRTQH